MEAIYGISGILIGAILKDFIKFSFFKRKKDYEYEIKVIDKAIKTMKALLGNMSTSKNSIEIFLKEKDKNKRKKALEDITNCIQYFENNRRDLFLFIYKEKSPIFIDFAIVLQTMLNNYKKKDLHKIDTTFAKFKLLYNEYYEQLERFEKKPRIL